MNKRILVPGWGGKELFGVSLELLDYLSTYGTPRILLPNDVYVEGDLLFLPGGPDISVSSYNDEQAPGFYTSNACQYRQFFLDKRLKNYIGKISIFGVCMGHQALNLAFGGTMNQDIYHYKDDKGFHELYLMNGEIISEIDGKKKRSPIMFNSSHHQGFKANQLGEGLIAHAQSCEGYIERMRHERLNIASVQYHSERQYDVWSDAIIKEFLNLK